MSKQPQRWLFQPSILLSLEQMTWILAWDAHEEKRELTDLDWTEIESRVNQAIIDVVSIEDVDDILDDIDRMRRMELMEWAADQIQRTERGPDLG